MTGSLRAVIADDELIARRILEEELATIPGVVIAGHAENGKQAIEVINAVRPDVVLLDIQMPGCDGFEVVSSLAPLPPAIIFVTAFDQHALRAFEAGAAGYLLKPVRQERLRAAIEKARAAVRHPVQTAEAVSQTLEAAQRSNRGKVVGKRGNEYFLLDLDEVIAFRAEGELVWIITRQKRYLANHTLRELATRYEGREFRRIHRGALINFDHVRKVTTLSSQRWCVTLSNDLELIVSKRRAHTILGVLRS